VWPNRERRRAWTIAERYGWDATSEICLQQKHSLVFYIPKCMLLTLNADGIATVDWECVSICIVELSCEKTVVTWNEFANSRVLGGLSNTTVCSLQSCQAVCEHNVNCTGIDWDPGHPENEYCWLHGPWSGNRRIDATGITHYDINRTDICLSTLLLTVFC